VVSGGVDLAISGGLRNVRMQDGDYLDEDGGELKKVPGPCLRGMSLGQAYTALALRLGESLVLPLLPFALRPSDESR